MQVTLCSLEVPPTGTQATEGSSLGQSTVPRVSDVMNILLKRESARAGLTSLYPRRVGLRLIRCACLRAGTVDSRAEVSGEACAPSDTALKFFQTRISINRPFL